MKRFLIAASIFLMSGCNEASISGDFVLAGDTDQNATLSLNDGKNFSLCWDGCVKGEFSIIPIDESRGRIELSGLGVGKKFKKMISSSHSDNFSSIPESDIGYKSDDYIDVDISYGLLRNRIYIFTEPDIYFEDA